MTNQRRRPQASKGTKSGNSKYIEAMLDLRNGSRTSPVPSGTAYKRKPKHTKKGWTE